MGLDMMGPLPMTPEGYRYLLATIDHCTGYANAVPLPDKRALTVWHGLKDMFCRFGFPAEVITDNENEFVAQEIREEFARHGIKQLRMTPLRPQSNGMAERFVRSLKDTLRKCTNNTPRDWAKYLAEGLWAYRLSPQATRPNRSPYEALFGQGPPQVHPPQPHVERAEALAQGRRDIYRAQQAAKEHRRATGPTHQKEVHVGDTVTLDDPEVPTFGTRRQHVFQVVAVRGKVVRLQQIRDPYQCPAQIKSYHIDRSDGRKEPKISNTWQTQASEHASLLSFCKDGDLDPISPPRRNESDRVINKTVPYSVVMQRQGMARTLTEATEVVIVVTSPETTTTHQMQRLQEYAWSLFDMLHELGDDTMTIYQERLMRLSTTSDGRKRNILGDGLHWLTGLATSEEVEAVRRQATQLTTQLQRQDLAIRDTIACVKSDRQLVNSGRKTYKRFGKGASGLSNCHHEYVSYS